MVSRILALIVWAAVAGSVAFWGLRWFAKPPAVPAGTTSVAMGAVPHGDFTKLLSGPEPVQAEAAMPTQAAALAGRMQLVGVVAPRQGAAPGVALLVVDGKPARAYRAGNAIEGDLVVQSISQQGVAIGPAGKEAAVTLSLPLLPPAATGTLPPPVSMGGAPTGGMPGGAGPGYTPPPAPATYADMPPPAAGGMSDTPIEGADPNQANQANQVPPQGSPGTAGQRRFPLRRPGSQGMVPQQQGVPGTPGMVPSSM